MPLQRLFVPTLQVKVNLIASYGVECEDWLMVSPRRSLSCRACHICKIARGDALAACKGDDSRMLVHAP